MIRSSSYDGKQIIQLFVGMRTKTAKPRFDKQGLSQELAPRKTAVYTK